MELLPAQTIRPNTVHVMDALTLLRALPSGSVDAVISDPPYGAKIATWDNDIPPQAILTECLRVSSGAVVWFGAADPRFVKPVFDYRPIPERILIWHVSFSLHPVPGNGIYYKYHPIYCWRLPRQDVVNRDVLEYPTAPRIPGVDHPAKKPVELMRKLIQAFGGDYVCDPFAGSGTTLVAAQELGKQYIGCDISAEYVAICKQRLAQPYTLPLFAAAG